MLSQTFTGDFCLYILFVWFDKWKNDPFDQFQIVAIREVKMI